MIRSLLFISLLVPHLALATANTSLFDAIKVTSSEQFSNLGAGVCSLSATGVVSSIAPGTSGNVLTSNGTAWTSAATTAALSIGALDAQAATATGLALVSNVLSTQSADATHPGMVNNATQTLSGAKTFTSSVKVPAGTGAVPSVYLDNGGSTAGFYFGASGFTFAYSTGDVFSYVLSQVKFNVPLQMFINTSVTSPFFWALNENTTGFYRIGANNWGFTVSGTKVLDIASTGFSVAGGLTVTGTTTLATALTGITRAASGVISASELSGDATTSGSNVVTLATVNGNVGSFTNGSFTVNAKGLITAASSGTAPVTSLTVASANGFAGSFSASATPVLTLTTTITGILSGNGTAISAAATTGSGSVVLATSPSIAKLANLTTNGFVKTSGGDGTLGVQTSPIPSSDIGGARTFNNQSGTTYTFVLGDASNAGGFTVVRSTNGSASTFTVPPQSSVVWLAGAQIDVCQRGAGKLTIAAGAGVTINSKAGSLALAAQYVCGVLIRNASDDWDLYGDLIP